jgi:hypothetical protein
VLSDQHTGSAQVFPHQHTGSAQVFPHQHTHGAVLSDQHTGSAQVFPHQHTGSAQVFPNQHTQRPVLLDQHTESAPVFPNQHTQRPVLLDQHTESALMDREIEREMDGERERAQQARSAAAVAHSPASEHISERINRAIEQRLPALIEQLSAGLLRQLAHIAPHAAPVSPPSHPLASDIPTAPPGEPPLREPLLTTWERVTGAPISAHDTIRLTQLVDRYESGLAGSYSAYWVGRVMIFADTIRTDPSKKIGIKNLNTYLSRMESRARCFSTAALENRGYGKDTKSASDPEPRTPSEKAPEATHEAESPAPTHVAAPPVVSEAQNGAEAVADAASRSGDRDATDPVVIWRSFAGPKRGISPAREAELRTVVADPALWCIVLTNFAERYGAKANWANWDALMDHYRREAAVGTAAAPPSLDPRMQHIPSTILYYHPVLEADMELRRVWTHRYNDAPNKPAKQDVLRRLVQEHPLPDPLPTELAECLGLAAPVSGGAP